MATRDKVADLNTAWDRYKHTVNETLPAVRDELRAIRVLAGNHPVESAVTPTTLIVGEGVGNGSRG